MIKMTQTGRAFIAIAMIAFGIQHFIYQDFVTRIFPALPDWIPAHSVAAILFGVFLVLTGASIFLQKNSKTFALALAGAVLFTLIIFLLPKLVADPHNPALWINSGKAFVMAGANFLVAASLSTENSNNPALNFLEKLIPLGKYALSYFFILAAIMHFMYADFVATLVPNWIPAHLFWTYFAAIALIAGAIGMHVPRTAYLAASLSALMVFIWVIILHIPRAMADLHNSNEMTAVFEALTMSGMATLIAAAAKKN